MIAVKLIRVWTTCASSCHSLEQQLTAAANVLSDRMREAQQQGNNALVARLEAAAAAQRGDHTAEMQALTTLWGGMRSGYGTLARQHVLAAARQRRDHNALTQQLGALSAKHIEESDQRMRVIRKYTKQAVEERKRDHGTLTQHLAALRKAQQRDHQTAVEALAGLAGAVAAQRHEHAAQAAELGKGMREDLAVATVRVMALEGEHRAQHRAVLRKLDCCFETRSDTSYDPEVDRYDEYNDDGPPPHSTTLSADEDGGCVRRGR
jgi:hypothetical protein